jgi:hypothetical protein
MEEKEKLRQREGSEELKALHLSFYFADFSSIEELESMNRFLEEADVLALARAGGNRETLEILNRVSLGKDSFERVVERKELDSTWWPLVKVLEGQGKPVILLNLDYAREEKQDFSFSLCEKEEVWADGMRLGSQANFMDGNFQRALERRMAWMLHWAQLENLRERLMADNLMRLFNWKDELGKERAKVLVVSGFSNLSLLKRLERKENVEARLVFSGEAYLSILDESWQDLQREGESWGKKTIARTFVEAELKNLFLDKVLKNDKDRVLVARWITNQFGLEEIENISKRMGEEAVDKFCVECDLKALSEYHYCTQCGKKLSRICDWEIVRKIWEEELSQKGIQDLRDRERIGELLEVAKWDKINK